LLLLALAALAHDANADATRAEQSFATGLRAFDAQDYAKAADYFSLAYVDEPRGRYLWNLAIAEQKVGRFVAAIKHFGVYKSAPDATTPHLSVVDALIAQARGAVGQVVVQAPDGATVVLDGMPLDVGASRDPVVVPPGRHIVEARLGDQVGHAEVSVTAGSIETVTVPLETPAASAPVVVPPLAASAGAVPTRDRAMSADQPSWWTTRRAVGVAVASVGAASFGLNLVFAALAHRASDPRTHNTYATLTYVTFGGGSLGVAVGAALVLWPDSRPRTAVAPLLSPECTGLLVQREF
jgi:hypothetical protein